MAKFIYLYTGGSAPESEEEGKKVMAAWMSWFGAMGNHVTDVGNSFGASAAVNGGATLGATGYSIVDAGSLEEATTYAKGCPILADGGNVEVYEAVNM
jgi:hypothetical protein